MNTALVIMAAGIGSRFGGGIKQLAPVDNAGHILMDYSIHDAIEAGFSKIVFIIPRDIEADFRRPSVTGLRLSALLAVRRYAKPSRRGRTFLPDLQCPKDAPSPGVRDRLCFLQRI